MRQAFNIFSLFDSAAHKSPKERSCELCRESEVNGNIFFSLSWTEPNLMSNILTKSFCSIWLHTAFILTCISTVDWWKETFSRFQLSPIVLVSTFNCFILLSDTEQVRNVLSTRAKRITSCILLICGFWHILYRIVCEFCSSFFSSAEIWEEEGHTHFSTSWFEQLFVLPSSCSKETEWDCLGLFTAWHEDTKTSPKDCSCLST
jgi:hypothetical protein